MAEYKYRALGWKDDDIASLNVVDGTASDNQVELQITKQGAGETIDGPAIVGKDGITISKKDAVDSEKIEISGSGLVQKVSTATQDARVYGLNKDGTQTVFALSQLVPGGGNVAQYTSDNNIRTSTPINDLDCANKKFVEDAIATSSTTVDGTSIVKDTNGKIQLNQEYIKYLDNQLYQPPAISVFTMLDAAGAALLTNNELGTTLRVAAFNHKETNIKNIQGDNVALHINNAAAATTSTAKKDVIARVTLPTVLEITGDTKFTLKGMNTKPAAFSRDYQVNFYRYAYTATTDATTAPTSGATQQAAVSTFASNGSTFNYTKGAYIYFYTDNTGKKVQTNVLGQWADVDTTDMGKVTLTQSNGATHEYTCYRIGPFIETGSAKYRV